MDVISAAQVLLLSIILVPGAVFAMLGVAWLLGWEPSERLVALVTTGAYVLATLASVGVAAAMVAEGRMTVSVFLGQWFQVHAYQFPLVVSVDRLSWPMVFLTTVLTSLVSFFSARYIHRDPGFFRFFFLLNLFALGCVIVFTAGALDLLVAGWELVGITSVLLIGFFCRRAEPVRGAAYAFTTYRLCDVGLLIGVAALHVMANTATFSELFTGEWPNQSVRFSPQVAAIIGPLLLLAACGKSAQVPFSGWLPRAMEGPTPSSAIFYGALSVHIGAYLLLRAAPLIEASILTSALVVLIGTLTTLHGTLAGRVAADAKTALAFASLTQVGVIFVEIGLGFHWLALLHIVGHSFMRSLQFLRAPSLLHDHHQLHAASGGDLGHTGRLYERLLPERVQAWLYRFAVERSHLEPLLDRLVARPALRLAQRMNGPRHD